MADPFTAMLVISTVVSAASSMSAANQQKGMYAQQAQLAQSQSRSEALRVRQSELGYRQKGVEVLKRQRETLATINARTLGALDPFSGSVGNLSDQAYADGARDFQMNLDNALITHENIAITQKHGEMQASIYGQAGKSAMYKGYSQAAGSVGTLAMQGQQLGWFK